MADQAGDIGFIQLLLQHGVLVCAWDETYLGPVLGCCLRNNIWLRVGGLGAAAAPTALLRKPSGARPNVGGYRRSVRHVVGSARWTDDRLARQVVEARCARLADAFGAAQRLHVSGDCSDLDDLTGLGAKSDCAAGPSPDDASRCPLVRGLD